MEPYFLVVQHSHHSVYLFFYFILWEFCIFYCRCDYTGLFLVLKLVCFINLNLVTRYHLYLLHTLGTVYDADHLAYALCDNLIIALIPHANPPPPQKKQKKKKKHMGTHYLIPVHFLLTFIRMCMMHLVFGYWRLMFFFIFEDFDYILLQTLPRLSWHVSFKTFE